MVVKMKTLKDLEKIGGEYAEIRDIDIVSIKELHQAAIEWMNHISGEAERHRKLTHGFEGMTDWDRAQIDWIIQFFNLTEEELK